MELTEQLMKRANTIANDKYNHLEQRLGYCNENKQTYNKVLEAESWLFFKLAELQLRIEALENKH